MLLMMKLNQDREIKVVGKEKILDAGTFYVFGLQDCLNIGLFSTWLTNIRYMHSKLVE